MTSRILVVSAVPQELSEAPRDGGARVRWLSAGMGSRAAAATRGQLAGERFSLVVSTGFSGGARAGFRVGDLVMASEVVRTGSGRRCRAAPAAAVAALPAPTRLAAGTRAWSPAEGLFGLQGLCSVGTFVTVEGPLPHPRQKEEIGSRYGAIAVDMETAGVAEAAEEAGVPWVAVRAILDPMEVPLVAGSAGQALALALRPGRWRELKGFWSAIRRASRSLGEGLTLLTERAKQ